MPCRPSVAFIVGCVSFVSVGLGNTLPLAAQSPASAAAAHREIEQAAEQFPEALAPDESLARIVTRPGMTVELVAAEPLVVDPVALDWGPDGRLWVVEMRDYPNGLDDQGKPGGRVRVLEDRDGDGRYDHATLFLDDIPFPTGIKIWRDGVLVSAAPEIFYAEDQDADGKADHRQVLFRGFVEGNQQHRVNGLRWGLDNGLYVANGDSGGRIVSVKTGESLDIRGRDLWIDPDTGRMRALAGQTQFGRNRDDSGNWFGGNNSNPIWHYVLEDRYLRRNPHFAPPEVKRQISEPPGAAPVYPVSRTLARFNDLDKANRFTSACSPEIYRDVRLGEAFQGNAFICEPVHNLVSRQVLTAEGTSFRARRAEDEKDREFLASADNWFRPTMVRTGPDGALWITDMYRLVIEHPKWIPAEWQQRLNLRAGDDKGRIYRVFAEGHRPAPPSRLDQLSPVEWVELLESPNGWRRDMAHQLLVWRADPATVAPLVAKVGRGHSPFARLHALCALDGLRAVEPETLQGALSDPHPAVRRHAIRIAERQVADHPRLREWLLALRDDPAPPVRRQLAYTLGELEGREAAEALARLGLRDAGDGSIRAAVLSSVDRDNVGPMLQIVLAAGAADDKSEHSLDLAGALARLAARMGHRNAVREALRSVLTTAGNRPAEEGPLAALAELLGVLADQKMPWPEIADATMRDRLLRIAGSARHTAADLDADPARRAVAIQLIGRLPAGDADDRALLAGLLQPQEPPAVQAQAITALGNRRGPELVADLLGGWSSYTPALRGEVLDLLLSRSDTTLALLRAVQQGQLPAAQIDPRRREQLARHASPAVRELFGKLFAAALASDRREVLDAYQPAAELPGDVHRGRQVFTQKCAACHRLEDTGHEVGPDLAALTDKSAQSLLVAILDPNRAVEDRYLDYQVLTQDGRQWSGMLAGETSTSVTLRGQDGKQQQILRNEIDVLRTTGKSLMPEGMERELDTRQMADLLAYLRAVKRG